MNEAKDHSAKFRAELERVLNSGVFRNSENLRRLLAYLGEKSLAGQGPGLKEFTIGIEAFKKPADYDPQEDSTVRVLASKLRHKLEDYYRTEGSDNPGRIELPKGHYQLEFRTAQAGAHDSQFRGAAAQIRRLRRICGALAATLVAALLLAVYWRGALHQREAIAGVKQWTPELELLWRPYLESKRPVLIALGTPLFTKLSFGFFRDPRLNRWEDAERSDRVRVLQKALESPYASPSYNFTGIGEATSAFLLCKLLLGRTAGLSLKRSTTVSWEDVGTHNVIFLGSPKFNPQLKDIPFEQEFVIDGGSLRNLRPRPGEPEKFPEIWTPSHSTLLEDHALITRLPGLHGHGEITILAASSTEGTWAAAEYVTQPLHAADLVPRLRLASGNLPEAYQIVIRAKFNNQVPVETSYVIHRVLKAPPRGRAR